MKPGTFYSLYGKALTLFLGKDNLNVYQSITPDLDLVKKNKELGIELARGRGDRSHQEDRMGAMSISLPRDKKDIPQELMVDILKKSLEILDNQCREKYTDGTVLCMTVAVVDGPYFRSKGSEMGLQPSRAMNLFLKKYAVLFKHIIKKYEQSLITIQ
jgi:hypothetical protein